MSPRPAAESESAEPAGTDQMPPDPSPPATTGARRLGEDGPLLSWMQAAGAGAAVAGGKGWSLGRLARYGFRVPDGVVLAADAYRQHLVAAQIDGLRASLADLLADPAEGVDLPETVAVLGSIRDTIESTPLPCSAVSAVRALVEGGVLAGRPLAIRSSATAEDSAEASFAGIHESILNVVGLNATLDAVRRCYASLWTPRAVAYRRRMRVSDDGVACAVVICAMVGRAGHARDAGRAARAGEGPQAGEPEQVRTSGQAAEAGQDRVTVEAGEAWQAGETVQAGQPVDYPVQPLQAPVAAGVAFSADPRTGRRDRIIIDAAPGLGEALVSGHVEPAEIEVGLDGWELTVVARRGKHAGLLSDAQALALARIVLRVHWSLGDGEAPRDIEWAYDGERFWLVQARPVTRLPRLTAEQVRHLPVIWSNANLKDAVAGVPSALGYSLLQPILRSIIYTHVQQVGYPVPQGMETIRRIDGRVYFDLTSMQWLMYDSLAFTPAEVSLSLGGSQPEIPTPGDPLTGPDGRRRKLARLKLLKLLWQSARIYEREIAKVRANVRARYQDDISGLSSAEIVAWRDRAGADAMEFSRLFAINNAGSFWDKTLTDVIEKVRPGAGTRLTSGLLAGSNGVVTAEHGYRLVELARLAEREPAARAYLEQSPRDPWGWRSLPTTSIFRREMEMFLEEFGHRGVYEVEIANPRWLEDPSYLLDQIRSFLDQDAGVGNRARAVARRQAAEREVRSLPIWSRPLIRWLAERSRRAAALREAGKSAIVATLLMTRKMTAELGRRMTAAGLLGKPDEIFHLTWWDIVSWAEGDWDGAGARALVADRAAQHAAWLVLDPPDVLVLDAQGRPADLTSDAAALSSGSATGSDPSPSLDASRSGSAPASSAASVSVAGGRRMTGAGVSSGRARGTARVIRHPSEGARLKAGDILVAPSTDPAWTPLFLRASAVVMEVGGYLSHGAIVAREYGLPAVVNVAGAVSAIQDGEVLAVDGDAGEVVIQPK